MQSSTLGSIANNCTKTSQHDATQTDIVMSITISHNSFFFKPEINAVSNDFIKLRSGISFSISKKHNRNLGKYFQFRVQVNLRGNRELMNNSKQKLIYHIELPPDF